MNTEREDFHPVTDMELLSALEGGGTHSQEGTVRTVTLMHAKLWGAGETRRKSITLK